MAITIKDQPSIQTIQPVGTKPKQVGTGFTNIQRIAQAGQGSRLGQAIGGGIQATATGAKTGLSAAQQQFQQQAAQTGLTTEEQIGKTREQIGSTIAGAGTVEATPEQVSQFAQYRAGQYAGPTQLAGSDVLQQQATQAEQLGQQVGTTGGRLALLQRFAAKPTQTYTTGQSKLDVALLGLQPQQQLQAAQRATTGLTGQVQTAQTAAQEQAKQYQAQAQALKQFTESKLGEAINPLTGRIETRSAEENKKYADAVSRIQAGQGSPEDFELAGMGELIGERTYGVTPEEIKNYIKQAQGTQETRAQAATAEERSRLSALGQLAGQQALTKEFGLKGEEAEKTYKYDPTKQIIGAEEVKKLVGQKKEDYTKDITEAATKEAGITKQLHDLLGQAYQKGNRSIFLQNPSDFINKYLSAPETSDKPGVLTRKQMREDVYYLGDRGDLTGEIRDPIVSLLRDLESQQGAIKDIQKKYQTGSSFFGNLGFTPKTTSLLPKRPKLR